MISALSANERMSRFGRADPGDPVVDRQVLRVQEALAVAADPHAGAEQLVVVGALREADEDLVHLQRHDQRHLDAAQHRRLQRLHQRVVRNEIGHRDHDAPSRGVDQRHDEPLVVLARIAGAARQHLRRDRAAQLRLGKVARFVPGTRPVSMYQSSANTACSSSATGPDDADVELLVVEPLPERRSRRGSAIPCTRCGRRRRRACDGCADRAGRCARRSRGAWSPPRGCLRCAGAAACGGNPDATRASRRARDR